MNVSVIIPVFNGERYLADAINSVLSQAPAPSQIVVIDDGSSDGSATVAQSFPEVEYYHQTNAGPAAARNLGLQKVTGDIIGFLDADDLWRPGRLANLQEVFKGDEPVMLFGGVEPFVSPETTPEVRKTLLLHDPVAKGYLVSAMLTQRHTFTRVGEFDPKWRAGEFIDWYLRAKEMGIREVIHPETFLMRRLHANNHGRYNRQVYSDIAKVVLMHKRAQAKKKAET